MIGAITAVLFSSRVAAATNSYESISTTVVGAGGSSSITFSSIPSTYKHLQIRAIARSARSGVDRDGIWLQVNGDTANNYNSHILYGNGSSAGVYVPSAMPQMQIGIGCAGATAPANTFGSQIIDVLDYLDTNKNKTFRGLSGVDNNGAGEVDFASGLWRSTSAITSLTIKNESGTNFQQYSSFALYGIKG